MNQDQKRDQHVHKRETGGHKEGEGCRQKSEGEGFHERKGDHVYDPKPDKFNS